MRMHARLNAAGEAPPSWFFVFARCSSTITKYLAINHALSFSSSVLTRFGIPRLCLPPI